MFGALESPNQNLDGVPRPEQRILGVETLRIGTNQEARPLPWIAGRAALGVTWLANAHAPTAVPVTRNVVVGKGETQELTVAYIFDARMIGAMCHGPVDTVHEIWCDEVRKWKGPVNLSLPFTSITVPDYGVVRIYPGADNQLVDSVFGPLGHPAYRGVCYCTWLPLVFGRDRTAAPQIEFILSRKTVVPGWSNPENEQDVDPFHAAVELAAHPRFGSGIRLSSFDRAKVEALTAELVAEDLLISPVISRLAPIEQQLADILQYADASFALEGETYSPVSLSQPADFESAPVIEIDDCASMPEHQPTSTEKAASKLYLTYSDRDRRHKETPAQTADAGLHALGNNLAEDLQRRFFTRQSVALKAAARAGRMKALPTATGTVGVLLPQANALYPGTAFRLRPYPGAPYLMDCRVTQWRQRKSDDAEVEIEYVLDYASAGAGPVPTEYTPPGPQTFSADPMPQERLFALPPGFPGVDDGTWLTYLCARAHSLITGYTVYRASAEAGPYKAIAQGSAFCAVGRLTTSITALDTTITLDMEPVDRLSVESQTAADADQGDLLAFVGDEICSIENYTPGANNTVTLSNLRRAWAATTATAHAAQDDVFILERARVVVLGPHSPDPDAWWFKGASSTLRGNQPLSTAIALNTASPTLLREDGGHLLREDESPYRREAP